MKSITYIFFSFCLLSSLSTKSMEKAEQQQAASTSHQEISLMYAFMSGKIDAHADGTLNYTHYDNCQKHYAASIKETHDALKQIHNLMTNLRLDLQATPLEMELWRINNFSSSLAERKTQLLQRVSALSEVDKSQMEAARFHIFMNNYDLENDDEKNSKISEEEKKEIEQNRDAFKKAFMTLDPAKINETRMKKLQVVALPPIHEAMQETIKTIEATDFEKLPEEEKERSNSTNTQQKDCIII